MDVSTTSMQKALGQALKIHLDHMWFVFFICPSFFSTNFLASLLVISSDPPYLCRFFFLLTSHKEGIDSVTWVGNGAADGPFPSNKSLLLN